MLLLITLPLVAGTWDELGCFALSRDDQVSHETPTTSRDTACIDWRHFDQKCRSGLPFYRFPTSDAGSCQLQCLAKGLDVAGIVSKDQCRCGASRQLSHVWGILGKTHDTFKIVDYLLPPTVKSDSCGVRAWVYSGERDEGGMPTPSLLSDISLVDKEYIQSIVAGTRATVVLEGSRPDDFDKLFKAIDERRSQWWQRGRASSLLAISSNWTSEVESIASEVSDIITAEESVSRWTSTQHNQLERILNATLSIFNQCSATI